MSVAPGADPRALRARRAPLADRAPRRSPPARSRRCRRATSTCATRRRRRARRSASGSSVLQRRQGDPASARAPRQPARAPAIARPRTALARSASAPRRAARRRSRAARRAARRLPAADPGRPAHRRRLRRRASRAGSTASVPLPVRLARAGDASSRPGSGSRPTDAHLLLDPALRLDARRDDASPGRTGRRATCCFESLAVAVGPGRGRGRADRHGPRRRRGRRRGARAPAGLTIAQDEATLGGLRHAARRGGARAPSSSCRSTEIAARAARAAPAEAGAMRRRSSEIAALVHARDRHLVSRGADAVRSRPRSTRVDRACDPPRFLRRAARPGADGPLHVARLIDEVTVKETFFLRERGELRRDRLAGAARPAPARGGSSAVRVWSRGLRDRRGGVHARAARLRGASAPRTPPVTILATDISAGALARARRGRLPASARPRARARRCAQRYFSSEGDRLVVGDRLALTRRVRAPQPRPRPDAAARRGAVRPDRLPQRPDLLRPRDGRPRDRRARRALAPGGTLVLGAADALCGALGACARLATAGAPLAPSRSAGAAALRRPLGRLGDPAPAHEHVGAWPTPPAPAGPKSVISRTGAIARRRPAQRIRALPARPGRARGGRCRRRGRLAAPGAVRRAAVRARRVPARPRLRERSATLPRRAGPTSRLCARSTRRVTGTSRSSARSTSATSSRRRRHDSTLSKRSGSVPGERAARISASPS